MVPVLGVIFYIFFGRSLKNTRMITRRNRRRLRKRESFRSIDINTMPFSDESIQQVKLGQTLSGAIYYPATKWRYSPRATQNSDALMADIENARQYIHLQYYIFDDDRIGTRIGELLMRKAREGVKVRIIYDHIGSYKDQKQVFQATSRSGA